MQTEAAKQVKITENIGAIAGLERKPASRKESRHHARHHTDPKNSHYCTMTPFLNPILDGMNFWNGAERLLEKTFG